jgi:hypothetical protein
MCKTNSKSSLSKKEFEESKEKAEKIIEKGKRL